VRRIAIARLYALVVILALSFASVAVSAQEKRHQATGTIFTSGTTQLVLLKQFGRNQAHWNFVLNPKTKVEGKLTKGERVRIYYFDDAKGQRVAEQIKLLTPAAAKSSPAASSARTPTAPPQPAH
jgi:hypothetical protein